MATSSLIGGQSAPFPVPLSMPSETLGRSTFTHLMWALSYPGRSFSLQGQSPLSTTAATFDSCITIGNTLLDLETTFFTPDLQLANALVRTGARSVSADAAAYHFYPQIATLHQSAAMLAHVAEALVGTLLYPDQAATLVIGCKLGLGTSVRLRGPGIVGETNLSVGGLPLQFWQLRNERIAYPLGWDLFLLDGDRVVGLPRTTVIEIIDAEDHVAERVEGRIEGEA